MIDARVDHPAGPDPGGVGQPPLHRPAGQRVQQAPLPRSSSSAPGWRAPRPRRRSAELGYEVEVFTFHDSPRRAHSIAAQGGINAAKDYRNDGDIDLPALLRHDQGRRLPLARGERLPARAGLERDHRPGDGAGRAVRARVRRAARQPLLRRRAGVADVLRARADRPAAAARRLPGDDAPGRGRQGRRCTRAPRCSTSSSTTGARAAIVARDLLTGEVRSHRRARGRARHRRLLQRLLPLDERRRRPTRPRSGARTSAARRSRTRASRRSTRPASRSRTSTQSKLTLMSESLRNDGRIWVPDARPATTARRTRSPRTSATTSSSAAIPRSATSSRATSPRARRRG